MKHIPIRPGSGKAATAIKVVSAGLKLVTFFLDRKANKGAGNAEKRV